MNRALFTALLIAGIGFTLATTRGQEVQESDPAVALTAALSAACRANASLFANYLTADNAAAFRGLPEEQRAALMKRFSLAGEAGRPLISSDEKNRTILRCQTPGGTVEFHFGDERVRENLAFIPVSVANSQQAEFGMVRESGRWRILSLGLVLFDIPQLTHQWIEADLQAREDAAIATLRGLSEAIQTYHRAWGKLPESLSELGPAAKDQISPEQANLVNEHLAAGSQGGYRFRYRIVPAADGSDEKFEIAAAPEEYAKTGRRSFFLDAQGKIHSADKQGAVATAEDPLFEGEKSP